MVSPSICWLERERLVPAADRGLLLVHGRLLGVDGGDELGEVRFGTVFVRTAVAASSIIVRVVLVPGVAAVGSGEAGMTAGTLRPLRLLGAHVEADLSEVAFDHRAVHQP